MDLKDIRGNILAKANWMDIDCCPPAEAGGHAAEGISINWNHMIMHAMNRNVALAHSKIIEMSMNRNVALAHSNNSQPPKGFSQNDLFNQIKAAVK